MIQANKILMFENISTRSELSQLRELHRNCMYKVLILNHQNLILHSPKIKREELRKLQHGTRVRVFGVRNFNGYRSTESGLMDGKYKLTGMVLHQNGMNQDENQPPYYEYEIVLDTPEKTLTNYAMAMQQIKGRILARYFEIEPLEAEGDAEKPVTGSAQLATSTTLEIDEERSNVEAFIKKFVADNPQIEQDEKSKLTKKFRSTKGPWCKKDLVISLSKEGEMFVVEIKGGGTTNIYLE